MEQLTEARRQYIRQYLKGEYDNDAALLRDYIIVAQDFAAAAHPNMIPSWRQQVARSQLELFNIERS